ncbi:hypothetical protein BTIS_0993 [Bifidobacterium tissieri]|uniref:Uncharacterized protein n=1 Tax=Bifidobacterium tissieri TaxID=1630162 RepID=A0A261FGL7_9BIFI|nr:MULTISPECIES: hypothetical protein [Bifidobacterium]OZG58145.1 hypothetical protein BTIS_0993 [Bifidobacterium tissieri]TPF95587.1 hypothetical protein EP30_10485 [Bifidobacterium sp. UTCIF-39]
MAGKKDRSFNYWSMNYKGKLRRTWVMLPICIIVGIIAPFWTASEYGSMMVGIVIDIVMAVVWVLQLLYNMRKAREEEQQELGQQSGSGQASPMSNAQYGGAAAAPAQNAQSSQSAQSYVQPIPVSNTSPSGTSAAAQTSPVPNPAQPYTVQTTATPDSKGFEQETSRLQMQMAYLAVSLLDGAAVADGRVRSVYVHAMVNKGQSAWDCFFRVGDSLVASGDLMKSMPQEPRSRFFASGRSLMDDYRNVCARYGIDAPTELRITYDPKNHGLHTDVSYDPIGDNDPFMAWASQVYQSFHA